MEKLLHRGSGVFGKLPRKRLQDMLKSSDERLDSFWSGGLTDEDVHRCLWMLTRILPNMKVWGLQVKTYKEAYRKCKMAANRTKMLMGEQGFEMMVASILRFESATDGLAGVARDHGFMDKWMIVDLKKKSVPQARTTSAASGSGSQNARIQMLEEQLAAARAEAAAAPAPARSNGAQVPEPHGAAPQTPQAAAQPHGAAPAPARSSEPLPSSQEQEAAITTQVPPLTPSPPQEHQAEITTGRVATGPVDISEPLETVTDEQQPPEMAVPEVLPQEQQVDLAQQQVVVSEQTPASARGNLSDAQVDLINRRRQVALAKLRARRMSGSGSGVGSDQPMPLMDQERGDVAAGVLASAQDNERHSAQRADVPTCVICHDVIVPGISIAAVTSLPCGHTYHTGCITQYAECKGCGLAEACPFKCHQSSSIDLHDDDEDTVVRPALRRNGSFMEEMAASMAASTALQ